MKELERRYEEDLSEEEMSTLLRSIVSLSSEKNEENNGEIKDSSNDQDDVIDKFEIYCLRQPGLLLKI